MIIINNAIHNGPTIALNGYRISFIWMYSKIKFTRLKPKRYDEKEKSKTKNISKSPKKSMNNAHANLTINLSKTFSNSSSNSMSSFDL